MTFRTGILLLAVLLLFSGCVSYPEGEKKGSLVDPGTAPAEEKCGLTMAEADNAFAGELQIFLIGSGYAYSGKKLRLTGKETSPEFRRMLEESGFLIGTREKYDLILLNLIFSGQRTIQLQYPNGRVLLKQSYQLCK